MGWTPEAGCGIAGRGKREEGRGKREEEKNIVIEFNGRKGLE